MVTIGRERDIKGMYKKFNRWKDEVKRLVFEKENKSPTVEKNNENEENGPTMERNKKMEENDIDIKVDDKNEQKCNKKKENDNDLIVTLSPMEIRAFIMEVTYE